MTLPLIIALPLIAGPLVCLLASRTSRTGAAWSAAAVTALGAMLALAFAPAAMRGEPVVQSHPWLPGIGLAFSFRFDALALLFVMLILGIGLLVILYARYYLDPSDRGGRFYALLMLFMGAMLGVVLSENLLLLYVFWEATSLTSFLLVGYWNRQPDARRGARLALAVTLGGGLAMLGGILLIGHIAGSYELTAWLAARDAIRNHPEYMAALVLILLGAFTKSAQFPFHFWLPAAMAAPTPVSAYLHSATMVKAGVFLLARLYPVIGHTASFEYIVATAGLVTMIYGAWVAVFKHDLKGLLAYSTISHLGLITFLIGLDSPLSSVAAVFHIINHATFKASLFMAAGIIDHECGTRDMRKLNGLWRYLPHTATLAMAAAAAMAGVPLFNGFLSKEMFFGEALKLEHLRVLGAVAPAAVTLGGVFSVAYSARFIHDVFFNGEPRGLPRLPHEPPRYMKVPVEVLVLIVIAVGMLPAYTVGPLLNAVAPVVYGGSLPKYHIGVWHGFNAPFMMSLAAMAGGALLYWLLQRRYALHLHVAGRWTGRVLFERGLARFVSLAAKVTAGIENGSLQRYLALTLAAAMALAAWPHLSGNDPSAPVALSPASPLALAFWLAAVACAVAAAVWHRQRVPALILSGVVGLVAAVAYAYYSAPDLALTQLAIEVVTTVLLLAGLALLPEGPPQPESRSRYARDLLVAVAAGAGIAALAWSVLARPQETIAWYYLAHSVPGAGGANVVNVILVDFRGFDTLGEITVLGIAAIGVSAVLRGLRFERRERARAPLLLAVTARLLLPFALLVSAYLFLRGHHLPGGGFVAGLVTAIALATLYMTEGAQAIDRLLRLDHRRVIGAGLLIAAGTGAASLLPGAPFLTSAHGEAHVPLLGALPLASAMAFDLGVYLTVVGAVLLTLSTLARPRSAGADAA